MNIQPQLPRLKVQIDWRAYYLKFSEIHGRNPIIYKGKQLFSDGWGYSILSYAGPEYSPPEDPKELRTLQKIYWYTRWNRAKNELEVLRSRYSALINLQDAKSAPLQQVVISRDEETNKIKREVEPWNPKVFETLIKEMEREIEESNKNLNELKDTNNGEE